MSCFRPVTAWKPLDGGALVFSERKNCREIKIRCLGCIGCRADHREAWALRNYCESKMWDHSYFLTPTYAPDHLPMHGSLVPSHMSDFIRALRRPSRLGALRYFFCGEYGDRFGRPHYHALIFGPEIPDLRKVNSVYAKADVFRSELVSAAWPHGDVVIGRMSYSAARYVAGYVNKKVRGKAADEHYSRVDDATGEIVQIEPEFVRMSLGRGSSARPGLGGIGLPWLRKYWKDIYATGHDAIIVDGSKKPVPRYFADQMDAILGAESVLMDDVEYRRQKAAEQRADDNSPERLAVREQVAMARVKFFAER